MLQQPSPAVAVQANSGMTVSAAHKLNSVTVNQESCFDVVDCFVLYNVNDLLEPSSTSLCCVKYLVSV